MLTRALLVVGNYDGAGAARGARAAQAQAG